MAPKELIYIRLEKFEKLAEYYFSSFYIKLQEYSLNKKGNNEMNNYLVYSYWNRKSTW